MRSGSSVVLTGLAVADTLTLAFGPTVLYMQKVHKISINDYFLTCKFQRYLKSVFSYYASWLLIVFTIFRVIAVYLPHKANVYCTRKRAFIAAVVTFAASFVVNLDTIIYIHSTHNKQQSKEMLVHWIQIYLLHSLLTVGHVNNNVCNTICSFGNK